MNILDPDESRFGMGAPYDHIDIGWLEQRLNEQAGVRRSRLAAYFDGVMEFVQETPPLSRSPSPEPEHSRSWKTGINDYSTRPRTSLEHSSHRRASGNLPRLPTRRSTIESDSDLSDMQQRRKRRQVTPVRQHKPLHHHRLLRPLKQIRRSSTLQAMSTKAPKVHGMDTRSKTRRPKRSMYSGILKPRAQRRKVS